MASRASVEEVTASGASVLVMTPADVVKRLAALVPPPGKHLVHFHGALAPNTLAPEAVSRFMRYSTSPSSRHVTRDAASGPRAPYRARRSRLSLSFSWVQVSACNEEPSTTATRPCRASAAGSPSPHGSRCCREASLMASSPSSAKTSASSTPALVSPLAWRANFVLARRRWAVPALYFGALVAVQVALSDGVLAEPAREALLLTRALAWLMAAGVALVLLEPRSASPAAGSGPAP